MYAKVYRGFESLSLRHFREVRQENCRASCCEYRGNRVFYLPGVSMTAFFNQNPTSPCNNDCDIDADSGLCRGCFRTLDEISEWGMLSLDERHAVLASVEKRRAGSTDD